MRRKTTDQLVDHFAAAVIANTAALWDANGREADKQTRRIRRAVEELQRRGDSGRGALAKLLQHDRPDVRVRAATYLLGYRTNEAKAVLREVGGMKGMIPFIAGEALARWEEGVWDLDPDYPVPGRRPRHEGPDRA